MSVHEYLSKFTKMKENVHLIGRLDYNATGIILFSNSEELCKIVQKVSDEKYTYLYHIKVDGNISKEIYEKMIKPQKIKNLAIDDLIINIKK
jgi:16S rRNA U516 pseudouridylate synthase RsuA-like enzyme